MRIFLVVLIICFGATSCASTQEERLAKIDSLGESITSKFSHFLGNKPKTKENIINNKKPRSPLIHGFVYDIAKFDKFIFFYRGGYESSVRFSESLKKYTDETGISIVAYALDGIFLPYFSERLFANHEIIEKYFGSSNVDIKGPSLFLYQHDSYAAPIATGEISYLELVNRMNKNAEARLARYIRY